MKVPESEKHKLAINHLDIDPKIRRYSNEFEELDTGHLICELYMKGYQPVHNKIANDKFIAVLKQIEAGEEVNREVASPMPLARYKAVEKIITLKEHGYRVGANIPGHYIDEAYECVMNNLEVPTSNYCHPIAYKNHRHKMLAPTEAEIKEYEKNALTPEEVETMSKIYTEFIVKRTPKSVIASKFGLSIPTITKAVTKMRKYLTSRFVPQDEIADAIEESKRTLETLYKLKKSTEKELDKFDERIKDTYDDFIKTWETKFGTEKVVTKGIAYERSKIIDSLLKVNKSLAEERKNELELKGLVNRPIDLLQLNIYNSMENPDERILKSALNPNQSVSGNVSDGDIIEASPLDDFDEEKYLKYLDEEDRDKYYEILEKLSDLAIKDADGELEDLEEENGFKTTFG